MQRSTIFYFRSMLLLLGAWGFSTPSFASGFQIWEQDAASIGNYHAGYAAEANDASTAFYNPAGITRIQNQQVVFGGAQVFPYFKYNGTVSINTLFNNIPQQVSTPGGVSAFVPFLHYVAPINEKIGFGFSVDVPFGAKVDYGRDTFLRYANVSTETSVIDISPSLGFQVTDQFSVGIGIDGQRMHLQFDQVGVSGRDSDTNSRTTLNDTAYGYHLGALYQFTPQSRLGLSYHSQVVHHLKGESKFEGPLAYDFNGGPLQSNNAKTNMTLPPYTALSVYHQPHSKFAVMGSVIYTQWNLVNKILLQNLAGIEDFDASKNVTVNVPEHFHNTWNISLGADYFVTQEVTLRAGVGFDETPTTNEYRNIQIPDNNRYAIALGGHYQATKAVGFDLSWTHLFIPAATINPPPQVTGDQIVSTEQIRRVGSESSRADVFGLQVTWDMA